MRDLAATLPAGIVAQGRIAVKVAPVDLAATALSAGETRAGKQPAERPPWTTAGIRGRPAGHLGAAATSATLRSTEIGRPAVGETAVGGTAATPTTHRAGSERLVEDRVAHATARSDRQQSADQADK